MNHSPPRSRTASIILYPLTILIASVATGCHQVDMGGQTLPSPYYMVDDVQYFPPGPEFKLSREAAAMEAAKADALLQAQ